MGHRPIWKYHHFVIASLAGNQVAILYFMSSSASTNKNRRAKKSKSRPTLAEQADRYELYGLSVQEPEHEIEFFDRVYDEMFHRQPVVLREDFCGTFAVCCQWVKTGESRRAVGVDLDAEPLAWGREHHLAQLSPTQQQRVSLLQDDVRHVSDMKADVLAAQNFSFWIFKTRQEVRAYFEAARENLTDQGILVLDMMGGYECFEEDHEDRRKIKWPGKAADGKSRRAFTYVWEQHRFDPITHDATFHIHFRFRDDSALDRAFTYHWRFWTLPEVRELLAEAGFSESHVYWEGTDEDGEGDGHWQRETTAASDPSWIAYIVAKR